MILVFIIVGLLFFIMGYGLYLTVGSLAKNPNKNIPTKKNTTV